VADEQTCGKGLADNAVVPGALAGVAGRLAGNLELHMRALDRDDPAAAREHEVYERVARGLRSAAADLEAAATDMAGARELPMGRHDMAAITSPDVLDAFERYVASEDELRALLDARREAMTRMLEAMRTAIAPGTDHESRSADG
jgi:hypothetical protein